ncbi:cobyric acid synthase [Vibrio sp. SM6]|uniref:Cobyric acid synthase n=1 Tax=Vibrio agarilyticus TaxID=2726741 RepID=A0A7X8TQW4_9VIBR|nr:cobyric acid synthase [Vibrio agarilyticus]NLS13332.1 cobyric acid synthase [Vibrio agarilyticus]
MSDSIAALMVQGTTSDAGKSVLVAGIGRMLARRGIRVAPFKPQNMALNSAVTLDGGEIGRAQAVQAQACGVTPSVDMNPILIKPSSDVGAQIIIQGQAKMNLDAIGYHEFKKMALPYVLESFTALSKQFDCIIIEGAGSPAEINLRENDIANMGFAEAADVPVVIVADIDRGGVFAHLYGTLALLSPSEQARVKGFIINRFRGDVALLEPGLRWLEEKTNKPVLGVLPFLHGLNIEAEDAIIDAHSAVKNSKIRVVVPVVTRISNHTDFDPLRLHPDIDFRYVGKGESLANADLIILPGTKSTRADLAYLREQGWDKEIAKHLRYGGKVIGICGGLQMLGQTIIDESGVEGEAGTSQGLGWLNLSTSMQAKKTLRQRQGCLTLNGQTVSVHGYEIHVGQSQVTDAAPIELDDGSVDGALSADNQIFGSYLHGLFDSEPALALIIQWVNDEQIAPQNMMQMREHALDRIADAIEAHVDLSSLGIATAPSYRKDRVIADGASL